MVKNIKKDGSVGKTKPSQALTDPTKKHTVWEDAQGIFSAVILVSLAMAMIQKIGLVTGGVTGLALVISYATNWPLGVLLFCLNSPFYILAIFRMGWVFTLKTVIAVALLSFVIEIQPNWFSFEDIHPIYASAASGLLVGVGFVALFRHRASLGGFGIMALWLQDQMGWRAGWTQLVLDLGVLSLALFVTPLPLLAYSLVGVLVLNIVLAINHRPDRYIVH
jgi:uncharacterized membrane-anchored protein YitT (DUF2179 family)